MSIGRNEPCHCGSGKKYKKCCIKADIAKRQEASAEEAALYNEFGRKRRRLFDRVEHLQVIPPGSNAKTDKRELPLFDPDEDDVLMGWYNNLNPSFNNGDADDCLRRVHGLMDAHPELIEDSGLDEGPIIEVCAWLSCAGSYSAAAELIDRYKKFAPKRFGEIKHYLDKSLIEYALAGCAEVDIAEPLQRLAADAFDYDESLYQILDLLAVAGEQHRFEQICEAICRESEPYWDVCERMFHVKIIEHLHEGMPAADLYSTMLEHRGELDLTDEGLMDLAHRIREPGVDLEKRLLETVPDDIASAIRFAAWLHREKGVPACVAERHLHSIQGWIQHLHRDDFMMEFSRTAIVDFIDREFRMMGIYLECPRALQTCQAVYDFGEYLNARDVPGKPDLEELRATCRSVIDEIAKDREAPLALTIMKKNPAYILLQQDDFLGA